MAMKVPVEPDTAACLQETLQAGMMTIVRKVKTNIYGKVCNSLTCITWLIIRDGIDISVTVTRRNSTDAKWTLVAIWHQGTAMSRLQP